MKQNIQQINLTTKLTCIGGLLLLAGCFRPDSPPAPAAPVVFSISQLQSSASEYGGVDITKGQSFSALFESQLNSKVDYLVSPRDMTDTAGFYPSKNPGFVQADPYPGRPDWELFTPDCRIDRSALVKAFSTIRLYPALSNESFFHGYDGYFKANTDPIFVSHTGLGFRGRFFYADHDPIEIFWGVHCEKIGPSLIDQITAIRTN